MTTTHRFRRLFAASVMAVTAPVLLFGPFIPASTARAQGVGGTVIIGNTDPGTVAANAASVASAAANAVTAANTTASNLAVAPRNILDALAWMLAKTVIQSLTRSIVNWINSGFQGSPAFEADLNASLRSLGDAVANDFFNGLNQVVINNTGFNLRAPFQDQIAARLREEFYRTTSSYGFDVRNPYRSCYGSNGFSLNGWFCESQNDANNPYGRYQLARNDLFKQLNGAVQQRITELGWGKGFLSWRGPCGPSGTDAAATGAVNLSQKDYSAKCPIRTPGAVIENALGISVTSPFRQLELADSVNEIVAALMAQMVNQVLGAAGLSGVSAPSAGGGPSYLNQATDPSQYNAALGGLATGISVNINEERRIATEFKTIWQRIGSAANAARQACSGSQASQADAAVSRANAAIARADAALAALNDIQGKVTTAQGASGSQLDASSRVATEWQTLLKSNRLISIEEIADARAENNDSSNSDSLYSRMRDLQSECHRRGGS